MEYIYNWWLCLALILVYDWLLLPLYAFVRMFFWWKFQDLSYCIWLTNFAGFNFFPMCILFVIICPPTIIQKHYIHVCSEFMKILSWNSGVVSSIFVSWKLGFTMMRKSGLGQFLPIQPKKKQLGISMNSSCKEWADLLCILREKVM